MAAGFIDLIEADLKAVEEIIKKSFKIRPGYIQDYAYLDHDKLSKEFHPAVIILTARLFNNAGKKIITLSAIIQFIYLAAVVHFRIPDQSPDPAETDPRDGAQYPVLVGDYLYGRFFTALCKADMIEYLEPLANIICEMNVGGILRTQNFSSQEDKIKVYEKESGFLLAEGCKLAALLSQVSGDDLNNIEEFGYNIGMGYGLLEHSFLPDEAKAYLKRGIDILENNFPPSEARDTLIDLITGIQRGELKVPQKKYGEITSGNLDIPAQYNNKEEYVHDIFSKIAGKYDFLNTVLSLNRDKFWRKFTVEKTGLKPGDKVLDVCCGTGMISIELAKTVGPKGKVVGLDFCPEMLKKGTENLKDSPYKNTIELVQGNAMKLPFPDNSFDCATIGFGLRNVPDMNKSLSEMMRVVKPGGKVVSLEFAKPTVPVFKQIYNFYFQHWVPFLGKIGVGVDGPYTYLHKSWTVFPHQKDVRNIFREIGFEEADYFELTGGIVAVHVGIKPEDEGKANVAAAVEEPIS